MDERLLYWETHFSKAESNQLHDMVYKVLQRPLKEDATESHQGSLSSYEKLLMVLIWICRYKTEKELSFIFGVSRAAINVLLNTLVVRLSERLRPEISFPSEERIQALLVYILQVITLLIYI